MKPKKAKHFPAPELVSDHAVLRYLDRAMGLDVDAIRQSIEATVKPFLAEGVATVSKDGLAYIIRDGRVVSVWEASRDAIQRTAFNSHAHQDNLRREKDRARRDYEARRARREQRAAH